MLALLRYCRVNSAGGLVLNFEECGRLYFSNISKISYIYAFP